MLSAVILQSALVTVLAASKNLNPIQFLPAVTIPNRGAPRSNRGTGSRGCDPKADLPPLMAMVGDQFLDLTTRAQPVIWIYTPYTSKDARFGRLKFQKEGEDVYPASLQFFLPETPGVIGITPPASALPLEINQPYDWYVEIENACDPVNVPTTGGQVLRVPLSPKIERELKAAQTSLTRVQIYAQNHLWYETLTELAQLRLKNPQDQDLVKIWKTLLDQKEVGLGNVVEQPITGFIIASFEATQ